MQAVWDALSDPFAPEFMRRALVEVLLLSIPAGLLGAWVVMRRLGFFTHALGHATFPALVVAYLVGWSVFGAAFVASVALALGLGLLSRRPELRGGAAVGVLLAAALAVGAVLVSDIADPGVGANTLLFGSLLTLEPSDLALAGIVAGAALVAAPVAGRPWMAVSFDRSAARAMGLPTRLLDALLLVLLAAAVAASVSVVGSLMISGLFLVPAATARLVTRRVWTLQAAAVALAAAEGVVGLWLAYRLDAPPGASIAVLSTGVFAAVALGRAAWEPLARRRAMGLAPI
jgi:ABC-type Mn2+/Zn2+ transport system permease subunit